MEKSALSFAITKQRRISRVRLIAAAVAFLIIMTAAFSLTACAGGPADMPAETGKQVVLMPGQTAVFADETMEIRFIKVIADSRCPEGAQCIWAGEVSCQVEITWQSKKYDVILKQSGASETANEFADFSITIDVKPYPKLDETIKAQDYRLYLTMAKGPELSGGILATFQVVEEQYSIFVTNKQAIEQILALQRGESSANIPVGRVVRGAVPYNKPWSWHIDPEEISMAEMTVEVSDGLPSHVENDLDYWADTVKYFSPWSAKLIEVKDYR